LSLPDVVFLFKKGPAFSRTLTPFFHVAFLPPFSRTPRFPPPPWNQLALPLLTFAGNCSLFPFPSQTSGPPEPSPFDTPWILRHVSFPHKSFSFSPHFFFEFFIFNPNHVHPGRPVLIVEVGLDPLLFRSIFFFFPNPPDPYGVRCRPTSGLFFPPVGNCSQISSTEVNRAFFFFITSFPIAFYSDDGHCLSIPSFFPS